MKFYFIFAPIKFFKSRYSSDGIKPSSYLLSDGETVDKIISKALKPQIAALYGGEDSVKLVGFSYKQYDEDGWSFYPLQLFVNDEYKKIRWIKWRSESREYFVLDNGLRDEVSGETFLNNTPIDDLPVDITLCTDKEAEALRRFEHDVRTDILSMPETELRHTRDGVPDYCSPTFYYEFSRQISALLTEVSGCADLAKKAVFYRAWSAAPVNSGGWTYSTVWLARLPNLPDDIDNKEVDFFYRWRSLKGEEYLSPFDEIGADNILFELCESVPPVELNRGDLPAAVPDKAGLREFLNNDYLAEIYKKAKLEVVRPKSYVYYFDLKFIHLRDRHRNEIVVKFKSKRKAQKLLEFRNFFVDIIGELNAKHRSDISFVPCNSDDISQDSNSYVAVLDFGEAPMEILVEIVDTLNEKTKGIKTVKLFNYQELFESRIDQNLLNNLMNK